MAFESQPARIAPQYQGCDQDLRELPGSGDVAREAGPATALHPMIWSRVWRDIPVVLAFALLIFQAVLPWTGRHFVTQDGPSHLYTALVARDLLLDPHSPYAAVYAFQPKLITNWSTTVILNALTLLFGTESAEKAMASLCVVAAFFGFAYFRRSMEPQGSPWSPILNFLVATTFLWSGLYNFYIGMALFPFAAGYYMRQARAMNIRRAPVLSAVLVLLFFIHALALALALLAITLAAIWIHLVEPLCRTRRLYLRVLREVWQPAAWLCLAAAPAMLLSFLFLWDRSHDVVFEPDVASAWTVFPMNLFASGIDRTGGQLLLYPAMLFYMATGAIVMRRREWVTMRAAVFVAGALAFGLYLFMPDGGFGAGGIKVRYAWAMFLFGCLAASTVAGLQPLRVPVSIYIACFLTASLVETMQQNVRHVSRAVEAYIAALRPIPAGATFVRVRFSTETARNRFGFQDVIVDPLYHVDARVAAQRGLIDLSDYQAISNAFPVHYRPEIPGAKQHDLWMLEGTGPNTLTYLKWALADFPVPIDYVVVVGDSGSEFPDTIAELDARMRPIATEAANGLVRVYQRKRRAGE